MCILLYQFLSSHIYFAVKNELESNCCSAVCHKTELYYRSRRRLYVCVELSSKVSILLCHKVGLSKRPTNTGTSEWVWLARENIDFSMSYLSWFVELVRQLSCSQLRCFWFGANALKAKCTALSDILPAVMICSQPNIDSKIVVWSGS